MSEMNRLVVFILGEQPLALPLAQVERVVQAVEVTAAVGAPETVLGVINLEGQILPVLDIRKRFGLPARERELSDQFIIAQTSRRTVALVADTVRGVIECLDVEAASFSEPFLPGLAYVNSVVKEGNELILVCNLDRLFSADEEARLNELVAEEPKV